MKMTYPDFAEATALEIYKEPDHRLFVEFSVVEGGHKLTFMIRSANYTLQLTRATKEELRSVASGVLNWIVCWAAKADPSISDIDQLRWMASITGEVDATRRFGDGSK